MISRARSNKVYIIIGIMTLIFVFIFLMFMLSKEKSLSVGAFNENFSADEIYFGMDEDDLIKAWGNGEYQEGFGGHFRKYKEKEIEIGIAGDSDHDLYGSISSIQFTNTNYSIFDVKIGDPIEATENKLALAGFENNTSKRFTNGEWVVQLTGKDTIDFIQIYFEDKDLRDRQY